MVKYDRETNTFKSKLKTYTMDEVDEIKIYSWVRNGDLSLKHFKRYILLKKIMDIHEYRRKNYPGEFHS